MTLTGMFTRSFLDAVAGRALRSFCQGVLVGFTYSQISPENPLNVLKFNGWLTTLGCGLGMALLSALTSFATAAVRADGAISGSEMPNGKVVAVETGSGLVVAGQASPVATGTPVDVEQSAAVGESDEPWEDISLDDVPEPDGFDDGGKHR